MKGHSRLLSRPWMLPLAFVAVIAGHVIVYYTLPHTAAVVSGVIILVAIKHLGFLSPLYALFQRRSRR